MLGAGAAVVRGARLGAGPVPAVGRGRLETGQLSKPVGSRSVQGAAAWVQCTGPTVCLCRLAGQLVPTILPVPPLELGRGGDQADPRRVPEPRDQCGLRSEVRAL